MWNVTQKYVQRMHWDRENERSRAISIMKMSVRQYTVAVTALGFQRQHQLCPIRMGTGRDPGQEGSDEDTNRREGVEYVCRAGRAMERGENHCEEGGGWRRRRRERGSVWYDEGNKRTARKANKACAGGLGPWICLLIYKGCIDTDVLKSSSTSNMTDMIRLVCITLYLSTKCGTESCFCEYLSVCTRDFFSS